MKFIPENLYHIYNRSNQGKPLFFNRENYLFFLRKIRTGFLKHCNILAYCLMPNHFHLLVYIKNDINEKALTSSIGILQRSYTQAINKQNRQTGSLFQQHYKAKCVSGENMNYYPLNCFIYIHQNPLLSKLVEKIEDWEFSSFKDYLGERHGSLCSQNLVRELLNLPNNNDFYELSYSNLDIDKIERKLKLNQYPLNDSDPSYGSKPSDGLLL